MTSIPKGKPNLARFPGVTIRDVRDPAGLADHADAWNRLLLRAATASPMQSHAQVSAFLETQLDDGIPWLCLFAYHHEELIGVMPLVVAKSIGITRLRLLLLKTPYDDLHTGGVDCVAAPGREEVLEMFVAYLSTMPGVMPVIRIRQVLPHSCSPLYFSRDRRKLRGVMIPSGNENYIELPRRIEDYQARLSPKFRSQLRRGAKKLAELEDVRFECRISDDDTDAQLRRFEEVEDTGWKAEEKTSIRAIPKNSRFFQLAARRYQQVGWMEWSFLWTGKIAIGAHFLVRLQRTLYLIKIGHHDEFSGYAPGNALLEKLVEAACAAGDIDEINFVADCDWHRYWRTKSRPLHDILILPGIPLVSRAIERASRSPRVMRLVRGKLLGGNPDGNKEPAAAVPDQDEAKHEQEHTRS